MKDKTKIDKRVIKTKQKIEIAFAKLLQEKPIQEIRVMEIAELADINRGTFYQHYDDIIDLLNKTEQEIINDLHHTLLKLNEQKQEKTDTQLKDAFRQFFIDVLNNIKANKEITKALFGVHGDFQFILRLQDYVKKMMINDLGKKIDDNDIDYVFGYISSGTIETIRIWINSEFSKPVEEVASLIQYMFLQGISHYK